MVIDQRDPGKLVAARKGALVLGIGDDEFLVASMPRPSSVHQRWSLLNDEEIAVLSKDRYMQIKTIGNEVQNPYIQELTWRSNAWKRRLTIHAQGDP